MSQLVKTKNGLAIASCKTVNGLAIASVKTINGLDNTSAGGGTEMITGQSLSAGLRNDATIGVGMAFTLGGAGISVTHLGRWVVAGNSGTHLLNLLTTAGTVLGSLTVNTSGASAGAYLYGALGSPVSLSASTQYVLTSDEITSGDQWYEFDTVTYTAVVASLTNAVWSGSGAPTIFSNPNKSYVPVSLKYS